MNRLICLNWAEIYFKINRNYSYFGIPPPMGQNHLPPTGKNGTPNGESSETRQKHFREFFYSLNPLKYFWLTDKQAFLTVSLAFAI
jgi:hypothetical protein